MRRAERIIGGFTALGKTAQPVLLAQGPDAVTAFGQDLVGIALVAHIPDDFVFRRVKHRMQRHGQFHHTKARTQMPASDRHRRNRLGAQFARQRVQLRIGEPFEVRRARYLVQKRGVWSVGHGRPQLLRATTKCAVSRRISPSLP